MRRKPPHYFESVRRAAEARWNQLERDPDLAAPWWQLFRQLKSPRYVVSELLQNADDAEATRAHVSLDKGRFVFEHNGRDFDEDEFRSLCRFGSSNKRRLHTIGFRGIGFKCTFSLGDVVEVLTPSLAVRFHERRFTEPVWMDDRPDCDLTRISVLLQDRSREEELSKNLQDWIRSGIPLLFFTSIQELTIGRVTLRKQSLGPGPLPGSERIRLSGHEENEVILFTSPEESFPEEAITEICKERNVDDLDLPPCRVQLVAGVPTQQRLYVVLPTGVQLKVPFSCNAPFIQDPARSAIKSPSLSPTNRWLLRRLGQLAAEAMLAWLANESLPPVDRARAYELLPARPTESDSLESDVETIIADVFAETVCDRPMLLTMHGRTVEAKGCLAPPQQAYQIWTMKQLAHVFGDGSEPVLHSAVTEDARYRLTSWGWLEVLDETDLERQLERRQDIPRPKGHAALITLWALVQESSRPDYGGHRRRRLAIAPVEGSDVLLPPSAVVRLPKKKANIADEAWQMLVRLVRVLDPQFLRELERGGKQSDPALQAAEQLLEDVGLARASETDALIGHAWKSLQSQRRVPDNRLITMAHLLAALDAAAPEDFLYITRDGQRRPPSVGIIATQDPKTEALLPHDWAVAHLLHDAYYQGHRACTREEWRRWQSSEKSKLLPFVRLAKHQKFSGWGLEDKVRALLRSRGSEHKPYFYARVQQVNVADFGFPDELRSYWDAEQREDRAIWAKVTERILSAPEWYWKNSLWATMKEFNHTHGRSLGSPCVAEWLHDLSERPSLYDVYGQARVPAELFLRTPDTEPFQGVEPFVRGDLDTERTKPLLRLLGVRHAPTGLSSLLERLRALARAPDPTPLLGEIAKWYGVIDQALARVDASVVAKVREAFAREPLILSTENEWLRVDEVFLQPTEEYPDPPLVHPSLRSLRIWAILEVPDRPSAQRVLEWLKGLRSGMLLKNEVRRRVRAALRRYPLQVWQTCSHWLALDGSWSPAKTFQYRLARVDWMERAVLFPGVQAVTADVLMLDRDTRDSRPFADLPDIGAVVEYRLTRPPTTAGKPMQKPWLRALALALARVRLPDDAETHHIRELAERLARTVWQQLHAGEPLEVAAYVDGVPVGPPQPRDVLWHEQRLFVREGSVARCFDALAAELAAPFGGSGDVADAIRACIDRSPDFITEYMDQHFELEPEPNHATPFDDDRLDRAELGEDTGWRAGEAAETGREPRSWMQPRVEDWEVDAGTEEWVRSAGPARERGRPLFELFERFAKSKGYCWDAASKRFIRQDGYCIQRSGPPFDWAEHDARGIRVQRYWVSDQRLEGRGVEIGAEVWGHFDRWPDACSMILVDQDGDPRKLDGLELTRLVREGRVRLHPATYRLREEFASDNGPPTLR